jgi:hypothetical protein
MARAKQSSRPRRRKRFGWPFGSSKRKREAEGRRTRRRPGRTGRDGSTRGHRERDDRGEEARRAGKEEEPDGDEGRDRETPVRRVLFTVICRKYDKPGDCPDEKYYNCVYCKHNMVKRGRFQLHFKR